jgi:hypothetical protein
LPREESTTTPIPRGLYWSGITACVLFAIVAVLVRGIRWDETFEHAQIIAGQVNYPEGHPLSIYVHNAFSLQTYLSATILKLGAGPAFLCGLRNVLFLLASILPVYALAALLTRSVLGGLLAALLLLQGIMLEFDGSYPTMVWPELYSNGHIGGGVVLLALCAFLASAHRAAWFMVGLIPAIHLGQWPPLVGTLAVYALWLLYRRTRKEPTEAPPFTVLFGTALLGFSATLLFYGLQQFFVLPMPAEGPFSIQGDTTAIWQGYTALHDPHRQFPPGNGHVILAGTILLCLFAARYARALQLRTLCTWLAVYTGGTGAAVWLTMAIHGWYGAEMPFLLIAWMPYRLINHIPPIALALMVSLIIVRWPIRGWFILGGAAVAAMLHPLWTHLLGPEMYGRYIADGSWLAFGLFGAALLSIAPARRKDRRLVIILALVAIVALASYHRFGAACVALGLIVAFLTTRGASRVPVFLHPILILPAILLIVGVPTLLQHQHRYRQYLPTSKFEAGVRLALLDTEQAVLLTAPDNILLQATTGTPALAEAATPSLISYVPGIGPSIDALYRDIYGYGFSISEEETPNPPTWEAQWQLRSSSEWKSLSATYGFTHVIAPASWTLNLPHILAEEDYALYAVTKSATGNDAG